jgi:hypothetical protein
MISYLLKKTVYFILVVNMYRQYFKIVINPVLVRSMCRRGGGGTSDLDFETFTRLAPPTPLLAYSTTQPRSHW